MSRFKAYAMALAAAASFPVSLLNGALREISPSRLYSMVPPSRRRSKGGRGRGITRRWQRSTLWAPNGDRECQRRRDQIEAGSLRAENGLVG